MMKRRYCIVLGCFITVATCAILPLGAAAQDAGYTDLLHTQVAGGITCHVRNTASEESKSVKRINGSLVNKHETNPFVVSCPLPVSLPHEPEPYPGDGLRPFSINVHVTIRFGAAEPDFNTYTCRFLMGDDEMGVVSNGPAFPIHTNVSFIYEDIDTRLIVLFGAPLTAVCRLLPHSEISSVLVSVVPSEE